MERDPFRFAWRAARRENAILVALVLFVGLPVLWLALDIVGLAIDSVVPGPAAANEPARFFLRYAIRLPERVRETPVVILPGVSLGRPQFVAATLAGLAATVAAGGALSLALGRLAASAGRRVADALAARMLDGIVSAPLPAAEEARLAALLTGETLGHERRAFDILATAPVCVAAVLVLVLAYVGSTAIAMGLALLAGLVAVAWAARRMAEIALSQSAAEAFAGSVLRRSLANLASHLAAVAAHGTRSVEQERVAGVLEEARRPANRLLAPSARRLAVALAAFLAGPLAVAGAGAWTGLSGTLSPGAVASGSLAAAIGTGALLAWLAWRRAMGRLRPIFDEIARSVGSLQARRRTGAATPLPRSGALEAREVSTASRASGRLVHADLGIALPTHLALVGESGSGARTFAALLGGQIVPSAGRLTLGGVDLDAADPEERARRIAYAGGATYLFVGSLRANLLYGQADDGSPELAARLAAAIAAAGLDRLIERRGLGGKLDPRGEPELADKLVEARRAIRARREAQGIGGLVEPFDPARYNTRATIGENILFGVPLGDTFREERLPSQPFVKSLLDREDLSKPLAAVGASIARNTLEIFGELPDEHRLIGRFALVSSGEREEMELILGRRERGRRGTASDRDVERLIGLAFRYCEPRHRLGLLGPELQERLVKVRALFAKTIPKSLDPSVEFFREDQVCASASMRDNLLFGRVTHERAGAEAEVTAVIRQSLAELGLGDLLERVALASRVDPADPAMTAAELAAVDLVRCLVREPDTLVVEHALDSMSESDGADLIGRLRAALAGRGLLVALPPAAGGRLAGLFDGAVRFDTGRPVAPPAPSPSLPMAAEAGG